MGKAAAAVIAVALLFLVSSALPLWAHAVLMSTEPAERSLLAAPPQNFVLMFNEPVKPLVLKLIAPDGSADFLTIISSQATTLVARGAPQLARGTHVLSWRVVSADGHPVAGELTFSVGEITPAPAADTADPQARGALWLAKLALYLGLFLGAGGAFGCVWLEPAGMKDQASRRIVAVCLLLGLLAAPLSIGLQGLDALGAPLMQLTQPAVWQTGFETAWGNSAMFALVALAAGLAATGLGHTLLARGAALAGILAVGFTLAASGHAATAAPEFVTRPAVFLHVTGIALWIGALVPLAVAMKRGSETTALWRFSRAIPAVLLAIVASGAVLAFIQLESVQALWTTDYGRLLVAKLVVVQVVLTIAAWNRFVLTRRITAGEPTARAYLARTIAAELALVTIILGLVSTWRFTPPPRALHATAMESASLNLQTASALAQITLTPGRAGLVGVSIIVMTGAYGPLDAREVTLTFANPNAGVEPFARAAYKPGDGTWRIDGVTIPLPGLWSVQVDIMMPDSTTATLEDQVEIRR